MKFNSLKKYLPAGALSISLLLHVAIFIGISGIILIQTIPPKQPFVATAASLADANIVPPPEIPEENTEFTTDAAAPDEDLAPALSVTPIEQIAGTSVTNVAFTLPPQVGVPTGVVGGEGRGGQPGGTGKSGRGGPPGALANPFGDRDITGGDALIGYLYDLKQTADRQPSKFAADKSRVEFEAFVKKFVAGGMNPDDLAGFYKVERPLGTYQIFIPVMAAGSAPKAFDADKYIQAKRWVILYQGQFTAPADGTFRFVGMGDDILVVRLNKRVVFDGSLFVASGNAKREIVGKPFLDAHPVYQIVAGEWFQLEAGTANTMEILLGENPGGLFGAWLQIQQRGVDYPQEKGLSPALPVFQLKPLALPAGKSPAVAPEQFITQ